MLISSSGRRLRSTSSCAAGPTPLGWRLRLEDRLAEIRNDSLAFDLALHAPDRPRAGLTRAQVRALWQRTEGWVAGLRLAAYALQGEADPAEFVQGAAGTETAIADYLLGAAHPPGRGHPAVHAPDECGRPTTPDLAEVLTGDAAVSRRLGELERNGVFFAELEDRTWYRYHSLFATLLEARLRQQHRALADELHRRATTWFIANDMPGEAEVHARAAGDWPMVGRLAAERWVADPRWRRHERRPAGGGAGRAIAADESLTILAAAEPAPGATAALRAHRAFVDGRAPDSAAGADPTDPLTSVPPLARPLLAVCYARAFGADARARAAIADLRGADDAATTARLSSGPSAWTSTMGGSSEPGERPALAQAADLTWIGTEALALLALADAVEGDLVAAALRAERVLDEPVPHQRRATSPRWRSCCGTPSGVSTGARWLRCLGGPGAGH